MATFQLLSEEELSEFIDGGDSTSTKRAIKFGYSKFENFVKFTGGNSTDFINSTTKEELDSLLCQFYATARKEDGSHYTKKTLQSIRYAVHRHFLDERGFDIFEKSLFPKSNKVFKGVLVKMKKEGTGNVKHRSRISPQDMEKMISSNQLDCATPFGLQNKVFIDVLTHFSYRGRDSVRSMKPSDFDVGTDEKGLRYVSKRDGLAKSKGVHVDEKSNSGIMFEIPSSVRCPVKAYLLYVSKLNAKCPFLWQKPKFAVPENDGEPWYRSSSLGVNTIGNKLKCISQKAGCSKVYTNNCVRLRATRISSLDSFSEGFESLDVGTMNGHGNLHQGQSSSSTANQSTASPLQSEADTMMEELDTVFIKMEKESDTETHSVSDEKQENRIPELVESPIREDRDKHLEEPVNSRKKANRTSQVCVNCGEAVRHMQQHLMMRHPKMTREERAVWRRDMLTKTPRSGKHREKHRLCPLCKRRVQRLDSHLHSMHRIPWKSQDMMKLQDMPFELPKPTSENEQDDADHLYTLGGLAIGTMSISLESEATASDNSSSSGNSASEAPQGRTRRKKANDERFKETLQTWLRMEEKRLGVEKQRLAVETQRLAMERERLKLERYRVQLEERKLGYGASQVNPSSTGS